MFLRPFKDFPSEEVKADAMMLNLDYRLLIRLLIPLPLTTRPLWSRGELNTRPSMRGSRRNTRGSPRSSGGRTRRRRGSGRCTRRGGLPADSGPKYFSVPNVIISLTYDSASLLLSRNFAKSMEGAVASVADY